MPTNERDTLSWSAQPPLVASWRAKSLPLPSCNRHTSGSFYLPAASAPGSFGIPASPSLDTLVVREASTTSRRHPPRPPAQKKHKHILRALRAHFLLIDPDSTGLVQSTLVPRCLVAAGLHLPPGPLAEAASVVGRPGRMCDWRALLRWLKAHPEHISSSLTSAPALVQPKVPAGGRTGSAEAAEAAEGACLCIGAAQLELGAYAAARGAAARGGGGAQGASNAPLHLACRPAVGGFGPFGVGGQPGAAVAAAAAAVRRVGGANPAHSPAATTPQWRWHARSEREAAARTRAEASRARALLGREFPLGLSAQQLREQLTLARRVPPRAGAPRPSQHLHSSRPHPPPFSLCLCLRLRLADLAPSLAAPLPSPPTPSPSQRSQPRPLPCPARPTRVALATTWQRRAQGCNPVSCIPNTTHTHPGALNGRHLRRDQGGAAQSTVRPALPSWALRLAMAPARAVLAPSQAAAALFRQGPWRRAGQRSTRRSVVSLASTRRPRALRRVRSSSASRSHPGISRSPLNKGHYRGAM